MALPAATQMSLAEEQLKMPGLELLAYKGFVYVVPAAKPYQNPILGAVEYIGLHIQMARKSVHDDWDN